METEVIMKRKLFDSVISQNSKNGFFSGTELEASGNRYRILNKKKPIRLQEFLRMDSTIKFVNELESQLGVKVKTSKRGKNGGVWLHPYLFIDFALYIDPKLKIEVYKWLYDELLKYRNSSGDSYKKMTGALYDNASNKSLFHKGISKTALMIKNAIGVKDWETATEQQLALRDRIHENIALLCDVLKDNNQAIRLGIKKTIEKN